MLQKRRFKQVDVFSEAPFSGNPLAVVLDTDGLETEHMQAIARWTGLSETTFVFEPTDARADYRVRIFTPTSELPFAGHPTLGTAHALLEQGLEPRVSGSLIQECAAGLISLKQGQQRLSFRAPEALCRPLAEAHWPLLLRAMAGAAVDRTISPMAVEAGITWLVVALPSAQACLDLRPDSAALGELIALSGANGLAAYGPHEDATVADYEVRALYLKNGSLVEDPVTGSANACIARLLQAQALVPSSRRYRARQGTVIGHAGRIEVEYDVADVWIGGQSVTLIDGILFA